MSLGVDPGGVVYFSLRLSEEIEAGCVHRPEAWHQGGFPYLTPQGYDLRRT